MLHDELGSLATHFASPHITEVMVNNETSIFTEDNMGMRYVGELHPGELHAIVERILLPLGKRLDRVSPIVDARLRDGSRLCAVIPPVSPHGMCVSIRRFTQETLTLQHCGVGKGRKWQNLVTQCSVFAHAAKRANRHY